MLGEPEGKDDECLRIPGLEIAHSSRSAKNLWLCALRKRKRKLERALYTRYLHTRHRGTGIQNTGQSCFISLFLF